MVGPLDTAFAKIAQSLIKTFVPTAKSWVRRAATNYVPTAGTDPIVTTNGSIRTGPPAPFKTSRVNGTTIFTTDEAIVVARLDIDQSGFDPFPADDVTVLVTIDGTEYKVIAFQDYKSGDLTAAFEFQIRK